MMIIASTRIAAAAIACLILKVSAADTFPASASRWSSPKQVIAFENTGFSGYYQLVSEMSNLYSDDCTCELSKKHYNFKGTNSPLNEELSVHFRGPLELLEFGYYVADDFVVGGRGSTSNWTQMAYYNSESGTTKNVTFLNTQGPNSTCLGNALTYASSDGLRAADSPQVLAANVTIPSNSEFSIFSSSRCGDSGKDCEVYREGIPAYHGFYGTTKMFLFRFNAPIDNKTSSTETDQNHAAYPNLPAIWLLNAHIPRTAQYPPNANCSCWLTGCGEFDIFEVMNRTDEYKFFSTLHTYQNTDYLSTGTQAGAYFDRTPGSTMSGGVIFDSNRTVTVFMSNKTSLDSIIRASALYSWISSTADQKFDLKLNSNSASFASYSLSKVFLAALAVTFFSI